MGCIDFGESMKLIFFEGNQVALLCSHAEQRLWKHRESQAPTSRGKRSSKQCWVKVTLEYVYNRTGKVLARH